MNDEDILKENERLFEKVRAYEELCGDVAAYLQADDSEEATELKERCQELNK